MSKQTFHLILAMIFLVNAGCSSFNSGKTTTDKKDGISNKIVEGHSSKVSLDWSGTYSGVLPCADCEGIRTTLILQHDQTFVLKSFYIGMSGQEDVQRGTFIWNEFGNEIALTENGEDAVHILVGENRLFVLDREGNRITGDMADLYILNRVSAEISKLFETKWVLTKLAGLSSVKSGLTGEAPSLMFDQLQSRVSGFAGCNRYFGTYRLSDEGGFHITNIGATKMACDDMELERTFLAALETIDRFEVRVDTLLLLKPDHKISAWFVGADV
jgi:copper homeostasis protein (lipoprotein)